LSPRAPLQDLALAARYPNLSQRVVASLKRYLLLQDIPAGETLPSERTLAESLDVSRTALREALSQLIGEGIVYREPPRSLKVADFDRARVAAEIAALQTEDAEAQHLIEVRVIIELGAVEAIIERATEDDLREIEQCVFECERRAHAGESLRIADLRFHAALLRTLRNPAIDSLLPLVEANLRENLFSNRGGLYLHGGPDDLRSADEHRRIFEALRRRDIDALRLAMLTHLSPYLQTDRFERDGVRPSGEETRPVEREQERNHVGPR
jgi:GntR family transcriptional repressor for pyruvate dehydrogenase complex